MTYQRLDSIIRRQRRSLLQDLLFAVSVTGAMATSIAALSTM